MWRYDNHTYVHKCTQTHVHRHCDLRGAAKLHVVAHGTIHTRGNARQILAQTVGSHRLAERQADASAAAVKLLALHHVACKEK